jgi:hypothetical protein
MAITIFFGVGLAIGVPQAYGCCITALPNGIDR